ncbi:P-loop containing nucleoside triphosphate hydrolase protein [Cucurbitaria berberidis CBS 394.84]|uniref:P-loop containing nucleoside triphosphate hydrolase protein n=1 Tax=Cucurbitaria berberidis CBS 394.84 TaxID=1168544 RepID=A0A9P4GUY3_9PLEO|nr:P-loop containing nucleoside triphosphate hydrolase protein [Cucurbitaria berberidis CBS 394.84]KAF1851486.1 P-loop containing nucleoside triphosphate hydrolase protein [Cucurbitaria berberidis CBS 394.84]
MPATKTILTATQANRTDVFHAFKAHCSAPRVETKSMVLTQIRNAYPDYHVTEAELKHVSLFEFADADKAVLIFDAEGEDFQATRKWGAVGDGIDKKMHPGTLIDDFSFARFQYIWENKEYLVYYIEWHDMLKSPDRRFYILHPRIESNITDGHCAESDALILAAGKWTSQLHQEIFVFDDGHWDKNKDLWKAVNGASWSDVILDPEMKKGLIEDVQGFFDNQQLYSQFSVPWKRGVILHGVPGNGKTVSIKALMSSLYGRPDPIPSLYVKSFETSCNTEQYSIRAIFQKARDMAPCLLIFEDLDSLVNDDIRSYFLNEVDGLESNDGILMIGSTNHLDKLDPAIAKRPSRFDRKYHFKIPGEEERRLYAEYWRSKLTKNETVDFPEELAGIVAQLTEGFSFAYLKELFVMALLSLVRGFKGDDFEIVDAEEAASADEEKADSKATEADKDGKDANLCTCAKTCSTCNKPLPKTNTAEAKKEHEATEADAEAKKNKMIMPTVDIPEHLSDNLFLKVIKHQIRILHAEMDNTKEEAWPSGKKGVAGNNAGVNAAALRRMRAANARRAR